MATGDRGRARRDRGRGVGSLHRAASCGGAGAIRFAQRFGLSVRQCPGVAVPFAFAATDRVIGSGTSGVDGAG
jgi:hypothetical protein